METIRVDSKGRNRSRRRSGEHWNWELDRLKQRCAASNAQHRVHASLNLVQGIAISQSLKAQGMDVGESEQCHD